jgi:hypothetical protein
MGKEMKLIFCFLIMLCLTKTWDGIGSEPIVLRLPILSAICGMFYGIYIGIIHSVLFRIIDYPSSDITLEYHILFKIIDAIIAACAGLCIGYAIGYILSVGYFIAIPIIMFIKIIEM